MLKIKEILKQQVSSTCEVDFYVPVSVKFPENDDGISELLHYRLMNEDASFIELSICATTGKFAELALVSANAVKDARRDIENAFPKAETGNPIVSMETGVKTPDAAVYVDFTLYQKDRNLYALWGQGRITRQIALGSVNLLVDAQNDLAGIIFHGFSETEWEDMSAGITHAAKFASQDGV